jgi:hypothetical protein
VRQGAQTFVSSRLPVDIVVALEMVYVDQQQRQWLKLAGGAPPLLIENVVETPPVGDVGQSIEGGLVLELGAGFLQVLLQAFLFGNVAQGDDRSRRRHHRWWRADGPPPRLAGHRR